MGDRPLSEEHERLLALLRDGAFQHRKVTLSSGRTSDYYIDCRRVVLTAEGHDLVGQLLCQEVHHLCPEAVAVGGLTLGADPLVSATALISHRVPPALDGFYIRKGAKGHGTGQCLEGPPLPEGSTVVLLDDVVTSGGSVLEALDRVQEAGLKAQHAVALVDRLEGGRAIVEQRLPLTTLYTIEDFLR